MKNKFKIYAFTTYIMVFCTIMFANAQQMTPEQVVEKSMESYNNRDIDGFMSVVDPNISFHNFSDGAITIKGAAACRTLYSALFAASPNLHSTVLNRTVFGNKIIDHESIIGRNGIEEITELVLVYEVKNEKITKITVLRKEP